RSPTMILRDAGWPKEGEPVGRHQRTSPNERRRMSEDLRALRRDWRLFTALTFLFSFGFAVYTGVFQNFLKDVQHVGPMQLGSMEALREVPGFLTALTAGTLVALAESRVAGLGLLIAGIGIGLTGLMPDYAALVAITVFWSVGFHLYSSMAPAITL